MRAVLDRAQAHGYVKHSVSGEAIDSALLVVPCLPSSAKVNILRAGPSMVDQPLDQRAWQNRFALVASGARLPELEFGGRVGPTLQPHARVESRALEQACSYRIGL